MRETEDKRIGKFTYRIKQLPDPMGMRLLVRLTRILAPALGAGLKGLPDTDKGKGLGDLTTGAIGDALIALSDSVSEEDMEFVCNALNTDALFSADGALWVPTDADKDHWAGRYFEKMQWIVFGLEVNYADFLGGKDSLARVGAMLKSAQQSKSPSTSSKSGEPSASSPVASTT